MNIIIAIAAPILFIALVCVIYGSQYIKGPNKIKDYFFGPDELWEDNESADENE